MNFIDRLRNQPHHIRKLIFGSVMILLASGAFIFWLESAKDRLTNLKKEQIFKELIPRAAEPVHLLTPNLPEATGSN